LLSAGDKLLAAKERLGKDAATAMAKDVLGDSDDFMSLFVAGNLLMEANAMPLDQILHGNRTRYGPGDLTSAWASRFNWTIACERPAAGHGRSPRHHFAPSTVALKA
jgi:hypothetical protein